MPSMSTSDASYDTLKKVILKGGDLTDQLFYNIDLQHSSTIEKLLRMPEVIDQRTFGESLLKQILSKLLQQAQVVLVSSQNDAVYKPNVSVDRILEINRTANAEVYSVKKVSNHTK